MLDWSTGRWDNPHAPHGDPWSLVIAGDWAPRNAYERLVVEEPERCYGDLLPVLREADLRIVNVETVLGDEGTPIPKNGPNLKGPPEAVASLSSVPWHVATMCNNHVFDFGPDGLEVTIERLHEIGLKTVGAGLTQAEAEAPLQLQVNGVPVAVVNCGEGEENRCKDLGPGVSGFDEDRLADRVHDLRASGHVVLCIVHAGREYVALPPPYIHRWYRRLADAGAHLVVGGHPHVPQGVELRNGCPICYSTGNFIFWMETVPKCLLGYVVRAAFVGRELAGLELVPYRAEPAGLRRLTPDEQTALFAELERASAPLYDPAKVQAHWDAYADLRGPGMLQACRRELERLEAEPLAAAENLRNYFDTPAHCDLILTYLRHIMEGRVGAAPAWATELIERWTR